MHATRILRQHRQPMIRFLGKRHIPQKVDHTPTPHPENPTHSLPESFAEYRGRATQHGPLGGQQQQTSQRQNASAPPSSSTSSQPQSPLSGMRESAAAMQPYGSVGGHSGRELGRVEPKEGEAWDRNELPARFRRSAWTEREMEMVESGGASMWG